MSVPADELASRDERFEAVLAEVLRAEEAGSPVDREALLARHPDLADELRSFFRNRAAVERLVEPLRSGDAATVGLLSASDVMDRPRIRYFGDYELLGEIARGGMGVVYRARQVSLNRTVALKMILAGQLASPGDIRRFQQEAEAAANLDHANILPIYEVGEHEGQYYFSMKLVEGGSLADGLRAGRLELRQAVEILAVVARAVHHSHQRGLLHRDLKPSNILLDAALQPHVTDFGLARHLEGDSQLTQSGAIVGTPSYMPPEQAASSDQLTTAADVYALGAILYEVLAGRPPYAGATAAETLVQLVTSEPPLPSAVKPQVDRDLETVCLKCLERDPRQRYHSAVALAEELERWLNNEPILARPATVGERLSKWRRRNPLIATLTAAMLIVAAGGLAGIVWQWRAAVAARQAAERFAKADQAARQLAEQERVKAEAASQQASEARIHAETAQSNEQQQRETAEYEAYIARISAAAAKLDSGELQAAAKLLDSCPAKYRGWEWDRLKFLCHPELLVLTTRRDPIAASYSPDGQRIVTTDIDYITQIWDAPSGHLLHTVHLGGDTGNFGKLARWMPDGKRVLAALGHRKVGIIDIAKGDIDWRYDEPDVSISGSVLAADGRHVAIGTNDGWLRVFDTNGDAKATHDIKVNPRGGQPSGGGVVMTQIFPIAFLGDNKQIAFIDAGRVQVWELETKKLLHSIDGLEASGDRGGYYAMSANGRTLAVGKRDDSLGVWNLETGKQLQSLTGHHDRIRAAAFSPQGNLVASASADGTARIWKLASGQLIAVLHGHRGEVNDVSFSADGTRLVTAGRDRTARVWDTASGQPLTVVRGPSGSIRTARFSPDGQYILMASRDGTAMICDSQRDPGTVTLAAPGAELRLATFSPDNRQVLTGHVDGRFMLWDAATGRRLYEWKTPVNVMAIAFANQGRQAIGCGVDGSIHIRDLDSGAEVRKIPGTGQIPTSVYLSRSGERALVCNRTKTSQIKNLVDGTQECDLDFDKAIPGGIEKHSIQFAAFSNDHRYVVGVAFQLPTETESKWPVRYPIHLVWETATGELLAHFRPERGFLISDHIVFLPDGEHMICCDQVIREIRTGKAIRPCSVGDIRGGFAVSPDGEQMLVGGAQGTAGVWNTQTGQRELLLQGLSDFCHATTFSPSGRRAITATIDGPTRLWDTATGRELLTLPGDDGRNAQAIFSSDGNQLLLIYSGAAHLLPSTPVVKKPTEPASIK